MTHAWTECDDIIALYLYKFGPARLGRSLEEISATLAIPSASMRMRMQNFESLDGRGGLSHASQQSQRVFEKHGAATETDLRALAVTCLSGKR